MMVGKEDLGLSLSLASSSESLYHYNHHQHHGFPLQLSLMPSSFPAQHHQHHHQQPKSHQWSELLAEKGPMLRGIDVNRAPTVGEREIEEEPGTSSPNTSTVSSVSGKRGSLERGDAVGEGDAGMADCSRSGGGGSDEEDGEASRKKLRLSKDQSAVLEESFKEHNTLNPKQKLALAKQLNLRPRQVEVWFQNRRARTKLKQTEVDCEFLKRCCENLTEENRRLQKEVAELRALKLSPQFYMQMTPPTTLTMCPSCERVQVPSSSAAAAAPVPPSADQHRPIAPAPWAPIPLRSSPFVHAAAPHRS